MRYETRVRNARGARGGVVAVEAALVLPIIIVILFGIVEIGSLVGDTVVLSAGARAGVRTAIVGAATSDIAARVASVTASLDQAKLDPPTLEYRVRVSGVWGPWATLGDEVKNGILVNTATSGAEVRVTLVYTHDLFLPGLFGALADTPGGTFRTLHAMAYMQRE